MRRGAAFLTIDWLLANDARLRDGAQLGRDHFFTKNTLDYCSAMLDRSRLLRTELSGDDLHPNAQGYAIMAPLADAAIKQALS
jgi:lysophospholipase L1-like esterase